MELFKGKNYVLFKEFRKVVECIMYLLYAEIPKYNYKIYEKLNAL